MTAHRIWLAALLLGGALASGCKCNGNAVTLDGGSGNTGGSGGAGGGGASGGGSGGGDVDAGDGTTTGGVGPGGFTIDGGVSEGEGNGVKLDPAGNVTLNTGTLEFHF